jgi:Major Facilitator Superfamily
VAVGGCALAVGCFVIADLHTFWQIAILYASVMALGAAFTGVLVGQSMAVRILPHNAGLVSGAVNLSVSAGAAILPAIMAGRVAALGWRSSLMICGAVALLIIVPAAFFFGDYGDPQAPDGRTPVSNAGAAATLTIAELARASSFWVSVLVSTPLMFIVGSVLGNTVNIAADNGIAVETGGYLLPAFAVGGAMGSLVVGWLVDRIDYRIVFGALTTAAAALVALLTGHLSVWLMALAFGTIGFSAASSSPLLGVIIVRGFGARPSAALWAYLYRC